MGRRRKHELDVMMQDVHLMELNDLLIFSFKGSSNSLQAKISREREEDRVYKTFQYGEKLFIVRVA